MQKNNMKTKLTRLINALAFLALSTLNSQLSIASAQGTAFTYQGQLNAGGKPANGNFDLQLALFNAASNGNQVGLTVTNLGVGVTNGLFTTTMDFGVGVFTGESLWLQIGVENNGGGGNFTLLGALQPLTPTPYAVFSSRADAATTAATATSAGFAGTANGVSAGSVTGAGIASGQVVKSLNGLTDGVTLSPGANVTITPSGNTLTIASAAGSGGSGWSLTGNSGTSPASGDFVGTTDNRPLELHVNSLRGMRLEPTVNDVNHLGIVNVVNGAAVNFATVGIYGATIAGGGAGNYFALGDSGLLVNSVTADFGTVGGGAYNTASGPGSIVGGGGFDGTSVFGNTASGSASTVAGGMANFAFGSYATVGGGNDNGSIGYGSFVGGGNGNTAQGNYATVAGGAQNTASNYSATVGGGSGNTANGFYATVGGGELNSASGPGSFVGGGGYDGTSSGGNTSSGGAATVAGGLGNLAVADWATVGGGYGNAASDLGATVGGGKYNNVGGQYATVPGGYDNIAAAPYSFAAGKLAYANNQGAFVWADSQNATFSSTANDQFCIRAQGGVQFDPSTSLYFGNTTRQMLDLYGTNYGIGVQAGTLFFRADDTYGGAGDFSWYRGGAFNGGQNNPGGGVELMRLDYAGNLTVLGAVTSSSSANGVHGISSSASASGVWGQNTSTGNGVEGDSSGGKGVYGSTTSAGAGSAGVWGENDASGGTGVVGKAGGTSGTGVYGSSDGYGSSGVLGNSSNGNGVSGISGSFIGPGVSSTGYGVYGSGYSGVRGDGSTYGGEFVSPAGTGLIASGYPAIAAEGSIGINTVAPTADLQIEGSRGTSNPQVWIDQQNTGDYARLRFTVGGNASERWDLGATATDFVIYSAQYNANMLQLDSSGLTVRGSMSFSSDRNVKGGFEAVDKKRVLERLVAMPITRWHFTNDVGTAHLGPMAQDFYAAFGTGADDKHIAVVDEGGVALAAIQGLNQKLTEKDAEIQELKERLGRVERLLGAGASPVGENR